MAEGSSRRELTATGLVLALTLVGYLFITSAGFASKWPSLSQYYDSQAVGFAAGHLHLGLEPDPRLLAQPNPFDHRFRPIWEWDLSLFERHYYLYWGPVPALALWPLKVVGLTRVIGDEVLTLLAVIVHVLTGAWLMRRVVLRIFPETPWYFLPAGVAVFGFANPLPWMLSDGAIYQTAIMWGQTFLLLGVAFALKALESAQPSSRWLALASVSWALCLGSRLSLAPAVGVLVVSTLWLARKAVLQLVTPLAVMGGALLAFNAARFGNALETGVTHQLCFVKFKLDWHPLLANLYSYFFRAPTLSCQFPFVTQTAGEPAQFIPSALIPTTPYWAVEPVTGLFWGMPVIWLVLVAVVTVPRAEWPKGTLEAWWHRGLFTLSVVTVLPPLGLFIATMRYLADARSGLVLLAFSSACLLWKRSETVALRRWLVAGALLVSILSIGVGALLAMTGYRSLLKTHNPALLLRLEQALNVCPSS